MSAAAAIRHQTPFLGLHYFDEEHEALFFGRDEQLRDLLKKLAASRFVTVIGSSGTGKSSLVRAGLIPAVRAGFLTAEGSRWQILTTHPGSSPIHNLAEAMETVFETSGVETTLRRGPLGLVEAALQCNLEENANLLVIVDQFEEIFRYQREAVDRQIAAEEASSFIKLLMGATAGAQPSIFVLITMRSDYLGACSQFRDLPERINTGLYLIPRMRRDQLEDAICGPAAVAGASFSSPLVQKLLNDVGEDPDQLPVLQHALLRAWLNWKREGGSSPEIDFRHYDSTGGVQAGLDKHADEIYDNLSDSEKHIAEVLFRCLTERDPSNFDVRRPTELRLIAAIAGATVDEVRQVAGRFREEGVSFLTPAAPAELAENTLLDITHESLIRKWCRLGGNRDGTGWVVEEAELREQYRELVKRARRALSKRDVLAGADLEAAVEWRARQLPPEWALRYDPAPDAFPLVVNYIERSRKAHRRALAELELNRRWERTSGYLTALFVLGFFVLNYERPAITAGWLDDLRHGVSASTPKWSNKVIEGLFATALWIPYVLCCVVVANYGKQLHRRIVFHRIVEKLTVPSGRTVEERHAAESEREDPAIVARATYASFTKRVLAYGIDLVIFVVELFACVFINIGTDNLHWTNPSNATVFIWVWIVADWFYETLTVSSHWQATLGMRVVGIMVTDVNGNRLSFWRASLRQFSKILSCYSMVGMFMPLMTQKKQALHDFITKTVVLVGRPQRKPGSNHWQTIQPTESSLSPAAIRSTGQ